MSRFSAPFTRDEEPRRTVTRRASTFQLAPGQLLPTPGGGGHAPADRAPLRARSPAELSKLPYRLYVDNETLVEPIHDLTTLRRGDHCMVGLNPVRKVSPLIDATFVWLSTWEVWPLFHHFVMFDDVAALDADGVPVRADGQPAMICEYSNTPAAAFKQVRQHGLMYLWRNLAPFGKLPLHDYQDSRHAHGLMRIVRHYTDAERDEILKRLDRLLTDYESYSLWFRNCEHAANAATLHGSDAAAPPTSGTPAWVSQQVSFVLFTLARFTLQLVGTYCLYRLSLFAGDMALVFPWLDEAYHVKRDVAFYHVFATVPVALQVLIQLGKAVRNLARKRRKGSLGPEMYRHLLGKEIARAVIVGLVSTTLLVLLPRLMHDLELTVVAACVLLVFSYMTSSLAFTLLASAGIRLLLKLKRLRTFG